MIHFLRTHTMAPGRQADAIALANHWAAIWKEEARIDLNVSIVMTGTLGVGCASGDFESMGAFEAAGAKMQASPKAQAFYKNVQQSERDSTSAFISNTEHEEFWRDA